MKAVLLSTWALFFGLTLTTLSIGLQGPLLAVRAFDEHFDTSNTGIIMSGLFAGYLIGALLAPRLIRHVGHTRVFAAVASISSGAVLLFATFVIPVVWFLLQVVIGFAYAITCIVAETWLNHKSPNEVRGKVLNFYVMLLCFATGAGAPLLNLSSPLGYELFVLASILISFGIVPILLSAQPAPPYETPKRIRLLALLRRAPLGVGGIFMNGLAVGALFGAAPIFADKSGFSHAELSIFMAVIYVGGIIFMWPIGNLADRFDRTKVLIAVAALATVIAVCLDFINARFELLFFPVVCLFSGLCLSVYGICSALTNDRLEQEEMVGGGTTLFICYSVGMMLGPIISTEIIEDFSPPSFFLYLAGVHVLLVLYAVVLARRSGPVEDQRPMAESAIRRSYWVVPEAAD